MLQSAIMVLTTCLSPSRILISFAVLRSQMKILPQSDPLIMKASSQKQASLIMVLELRWPEYSIIAFRAIRSSGIGLPRSAAFDKRSSMALSFLPPSPARLAVPTKGARGTFPDCAGWLDIWFRIQVVIKSEISTMKRDELDAALAGAPGRDSGPKKRRIKNKMKAQQKRWKI